MNQLQNTELTQIIQSGFSVTASVQSVVSVNNAVGPFFPGANQQTHLVALMNDGTRYGLKSSNRGGLSNPQEMEQLLADIAVLLDAPHACKVISTNQITSVPIFTGRLVNVIQWLPNSQSISFHLARISDMPASLPFYAQLGEWCAFTLAFGIQDRHSGNWVWNHDSKQLAQIDLEESLGVPRLTDISLAQQFVSQNPSLRNLQLADFEAGYQAMFNKIESRRNAVLQELARHPFSQNYVLGHTHFDTAMVMNALFP